MKVELNIGLRVQGQDMHPDCASQIMRNIALAFKPRMMLANVQEAKSGEPTLVVMLVTNAVGLTTKGWSRGGSLPSTGPTLAHWARL